MSKSIFRGALLGALFAVSALVGGPALDAVAQTYPVTNPTYIPNAILSTASLTAAGSVTFQNNGNGSVQVRFLGTYTGMSGVFEATESRGASPTWSNIACQKVGGARYLGFTSLAGTVANGVYTCDAAAWAQVRFRVTAMSTGTQNITMSGNGASAEIKTLPQARATYTAAASIATGATTHFMSIAGSASTTVRLTKVECSGVATAAITLGIALELDSTADTVDAGTAVTATSHDSTNNAATATVVSHTTSPTSGTLIGVVRRGTLTIAAAGAAPTAAATPGLVWNFGANPGEQEITLRGVAQSASLNTSAAFGTAAAVTCNMTWTEQ